ncbi:hypothetical protein [Advenella incenata]|uniref:hypothetical protein n=1 Tax=Advenella incenata TaxID=267800 RepID=UPI00102A9025|nr:hypothetical protein [Advenella incenata]
MNDRTINRVLPAAQIPYAKKQSGEEKMNELVRANLKNGKLNAIYKKYHQTDLPTDVVALGNWFDLQSIAQS